MIMNELRGVLSGKVPGYGPYKDVQHIYTVKNNRNFTDRVMGNCDKKSTVNREFTGKCPYILYY